MTVEKQKELIESIKVNKNHFDTLYKEFYKDVFRFSYSLTLNKEEAEDITSQVFMTLLNKIDSFEWQGVDIKYWLFRTSRNFVYMQSRKKCMNTLDEESSNYIDEYEISFVDEIIRNDLVDIVRKEMESLSLLEREMIVHKRKQAR